MNKKGCLIISLIAGFFILCIGYFMIKNSQNKLVTLDENVQSKWSNIEAVYQKRANLIPNLENAVKSYAKFEKETLTDVIEARSKATTITIDPKNMTTADLAKFQSAQNNLGGALSRLIAVSENYPQLKTDQQYINFQTEYTAIENSIRMETVNYNEAAKEFNTVLKKFPMNIFADYLGDFKEKIYFKAETGSKNPPRAFEE